jgi:type IV pilus assembly protein PilX
MIMQNKYPSGQRGVALVVVLLFILALTGVGLFSAKYALFGETLARNQLDEQVARQAAEAALRDAEADLLLKTGARQGTALCERGAARPVLSAIAYFTEDCRAGQCGYTNQAERNAADYATATEGNAGSAEMWWPKSKGGKWDGSSKPTSTANNCTTFLGGVPFGAFTGASAVPGVSKQPEYLIEVFRRGTDNFFFRVTARGYGLRQNTEVVMQSYVSVLDL